MRRVNIIGLGYGWRDAPYNDGEVWGITSLVLKRPEVDMVIDMNVYDDLRWGEVEKEKNDSVLVLCEKNEIEYVGLHNYPIGKIQKSFPTDYFTSTIDYAISLALHMNFDEIYLYGVNLAFGTDYEYLKAGADFWCGVAMGRNVKLVVHGEHSAIMVTHDGMMYGYDVFQQRQIVSCPVEVRKGVR